MSSHLHFPKLKYSPLNLCAIREEAKKELDEILKTHEGDKTIVLDPALTRPLNMITAGIQVFKSNDTKEFKELGWDPLNLRHPNVLFFVRPRVELMRQIAHQIHNETDEGGDFDFAVYFVPTRTYVCTQVLKDEGVFSSVYLGEFHVDLIPLEDDVLSLELDTSFVDCFIDGDNTALHHVARSIIKLQSMYGVIPHLKAKGKTAATVLNMVLRMREERLSGGMIDFKHNSEIDTCVILDRSVDYVSALVTPLTYEALIDEMLGIENGAIYEDVQNLSKTREERRKKTTTSSPSSKTFVRLNNNSSLYQEIRDVNISSLGPILQDKSREIRDLYNSRPDAENVKTKSVEALRDFVKKIPTLKEGYESLETHTQIAEEIVRETNSTSFRKLWQEERRILEGGNAQTYIEDAIARQKPLVRVLRLLCLQSLIGSGLKNCEFFKTELLQTYGYEILLTLHRLEKLRMLTKRDSPLRWPAVRNKFKLIYNEVNSEKPDDIAYVTSGYAPLSARIVQMAMGHKWKKNEDSLRLLPGPKLECTQRGVRIASSPTKMDSSSSNSSNTMKNEDSKSRKKKKTMLVYFVGGVTFMEISALRWLARRKGSKYNIVVATTKMISGKTFMESIVEDIPNALVSRGDSTS